MKNHYSRQVILEKSCGDDETAGTVVPQARAHNSLTPDGISLPVYPNGSNHILKGKQASTKEDQVQCVVRAQVQSLIVEMKL